MAEDADQWMSAHDTLAVLASGIERSEAAKMIKTWASKGLVPARAKLIWKKQQWREPDVSTDAPLPEYFWNSRTPTRQLESGVKRIEEDWTLGNFESWVHEHYVSNGGRAYREVLYQAFGVEFECSDLVALLPPHLKPKQSKRGRPPKYDWPAIEAAVLEQIGTGTSKPEILADVERAFAEAFGGLDKPPAESTIREHAATVWAKYQKAGK
ncbi:MAG: hypothetical protein J0I69_11330 [Altererythrobacter sp.]|nr:hypothetical protein [Altererythrobacter sp.]OJU60538.1 MAG: hypothetical protein BGO08_10090 [Altererythrobacter sp. 66-12]